MHHLSIYAMTTSFAEEVNACQLQLPEWERALKLGLSIRSYFTNRTRLIYCVTSGLDGPSTASPHAISFPCLLSMQVQTALTQFFT